MSALAVRHRSWLAATFAFAALSFLVVGAACAQSAAEGRAQARKAGQLAARGKCVPAVAAYTKAFEILGDPVILFNRAECLRKLGRAEPALADYERFLVEFPNPPNKTLVEQRIGALRLRLGMPERQAPLAAGSGGASKPGAFDPKAPAAEAAPIIDDEEEDETLVAAPAPVPAWRPPGDSEAGALRSGMDDEETPGDEEGGVSPWVWVGLGAVVVAAGVVAGVLILGNNETDIPESRLGNYKF